MLLFAGSGTAGSADGIGAAASFNFPVGIAIDPMGNFFVTDNTNNRIRMITPGGLVSTLAGNGIQGSVDGTGNSAGFSNPLGLTIDTNGTMYVLDNRTNKVRKVTVQ